LLDRSVLCPHCGVGGRRERQDLNVIDLRYEIRVEVSWVMTPYSVSVGYQKFGLPCCLHLQNEEQKCERWTSLMSLVWSRER